MTIFFLSVGSKSNILIVLYDHHTFDLERIVPNSCKFVDRENTLNVLLTGLLDTYQTVCSMRMKDH